MRLPWVQIPFSSGSDLFPVVPDSNPVLASGLDLFPVVPDSNPVLASGLDLFPVVPDSTSHAQLKTKPLLSIVSLSFISCLELIPQLKKDGTPQTRTPSRFALFVKDNFARVKKDNASLSHQEVMKTLGSEFAKLSS